MTKQARAKHLTEQVEEDAAISWYEYYCAVMERLWIVILAVIVSGIAAIGFLSQQKEKYQAQAVLVVEKENVQVLSEVEGITSGSISSEDVINTMVDTLNGFTFAHRVATRLTAEHLEELEQGKGVPFEPLELTQFLNYQVASSYRSETRLIDISVTLTDPAMAQLIANCYAKEYVAYAVEQGTEKARRYNAYLLAEAKKQREAMRLSEEAMQSFRERERSASLESMQKVVEEQLNDLTTKIAELREDLAQLERDTKRARAVENDMPALLRVPSVAAEEHVSRLTQRIAEQNREFTLLKQRYRHKHPKYIAARTTLVQLVAQQEKILTEAVGLLEVRREEVKETLADLNEKRSELQQRLLTVTSKTIEYNDLKRELETDRAIYEAILERIKEIDVAEGILDSPVEIHELAQRPKVIMANRNRTLIASIFLGFAAGVGIAIGLHFLDASVKTVDQAERLTRLRVLSTIPDVKVSRGKHDEHQTISSLMAENASVRESFRTLRTAINLDLSPSEGGRGLTMLMTSAVPGDGKTFCSCNCAIAWAQNGQKTLLVDADLRRPTVSDSFFGRALVPGLVDVLEGTVGWQSAIYASEIENLDIMPAGNISDQPLELLSSHQFQNFLDDAAKSYDRILLDSPPILAVSDTHVLYSKVDAVILVIRAFETGRKSVDRCIQLCNHLGDNACGVVLNAMPTGRKGYYGYYYSGKYYGEYYTSNQNAKSK